MKQKKYQLEMYMYYIVASNILNAKCDIMSCEEGKKAIQTSAKVMKVTHIQQINVISKKVFEL